MDFGALATSVNTTELMSYATSLPQNALQGDVASLVMLAIGIYISVLIINKLTKYSLKILKHVLILTVLGSAFYSILMYFLNEMQGKVDPMVLIAGIVVLAIAFIGVVIAVYYFILNMKAERKPKEGKEEKVTVTPAPGPAGPTGIKEMLSLHGIKKGKHTLTTMLTYILIAEFGVFSSKTVHAPTPDVGLAFFIVFFIGVTIYIFRTYSNPVESLKLIFIAVVIGFVLSFILGSFWGQIGWDVLFSYSYFGTDALVAFLTGIALSLFMAGKELQGSG
ncbi:MAG: hypothetical protein J7L23_04205 [Candidatus Diapherotrites archaeon]|nr:hypothetical protein [Candidatus Diapherotrites archaeon]